MLAVIAIAADVPAQRIPDIPERARGAERVVVASVKRVNATFEVNEFGDQLIVSHASLAVEEVLKGNSTGDVVLDVDGGTVDGVTLTVSSLPSVAAGERAVFFLDSTQPGRFRPHMRGLGILKLDGTNKVKGSSLTLDDVRRMAKPDAR